MVKGNKSIPWDIKWEGKKKLRMIIGWHLFKRILSVRTKANVSLFCLSEKFHSLFFYKFLCSFLRRMPIILEGTVVMRLCNISLTQLTDWASLRRLRTLYLLPAKADAIFSGQVNENIGGDIAWLFVMSTVQRGWWYVDYFVFQRLHAVRSSSCIQNISA